MKQILGMLPNFRKAAYELAKGEYFCFISSDDRLVNPEFHFGKHPVGKKV